MWQIGVDIVEQKSEMSKQMINLKYGSNSTANLFNATGFIFMCVYHYENTDFKIDPAKEYIQQVADSK